MYRGCRDRIQIIIVIIIIIVFIILVIIIVILIVVFGNKIFPSVSRRTCAFAISLETNPVWIRKFGTTNFGMDTKCVENAWLWKLLEPPLKGQVKCVIIHFDQLT